MEFRGPSRYRPCDSIAKSTEPMPFTTNWCSVTLKAGGRDSSIHAPASHKAVSWRSLFRMDTTALVPLRVLGLRVWRCDAAQPYLGRLFRSGVGSAEVFAFIAGRFFHVLKSGACVLRTPLHTVSDGHHLTAHLSTRLPAPGGLNPHRAGHAVVRVSGGICRGTRPFATEGESLYQST